MRIVSYNIRKAVGLDRRRDPARILDVINRLEPDVAVLQEADRRLGTRPAALPRFIIEQETDLEVVDLARTDVSLGWHGNAILVRKGLAVTRWGHIELPGLEPRGAVYVQVEDGPMVVGTHLGLIRTWRQKQMKAILAFLRESAARSVVVGDFNEWARAGGFEPWEHDLSVVTPGPSFHAIRPVAPLDRFAHGREVRLVDVRVCKTGPARVASDHLPIIAEARLAKS